MLKSVPNKTEEFADELTDEPIDRVNDGNVEHCSCGGCACACNCHPYPEM